MNKSVMILGGYGNFGKRIALALAKANIPTIIVGRDVGKATACLNNIKNSLPNANISIDTFDINTSLEHALHKHKPTIIINTVGPFQSANYDIVKMCIAHGIHYIDLADARDFVTGISQLDELAKQKQVSVISGASSVPGLSSALLDHFKHNFSHIKKLKYGISTAQRTANGLATASSILSYMGKPMKLFSGAKKTRYGWQNLYCQTYPVLGKRWMACCDIPDLDLLPKEYNIETIEFSAGVESSLMHFCMWLTSWAIRLGLPIDLSHHAKGIQKICGIFNIGCKNKSGMHFILEGTDHKKQNKTIQWFIIAEYGEGLEIPTIPAIILTKKILRREFNKVGAFPCVGLITLEEYLDELKGFAFQVFCDDKG